jgi:hypothetical protein
MPTLRDCWGFATLRPVGSIPRLRAYSRSGPWRGHILLTSWPHNFYVAHPFGIGASIMGRVGSDRFLTRKSAPVD